MIRRCYASEVVGGGVHPLHPEVDSPAGAVADGRLRLARSFGRPNGADQNDGVPAELHKQTPTNGHGHHRSDQAPLQEDVAQRAGVDHVCDKHPACRGEG